VIPTVLKKKYNSTTKQKKNHKPKTIPRQPSDLKLMAEGVSLISKQNQYNYMPIS